MADETPETLLASARELEAEAAASGEDAHGRELRRRAAELRVRAIGEKAYPVLVCPSCQHVTGWLGGDGSCDSCQRRAQLEAAYADPHGGWVTVDDTRAPDDEPHEQPPLAARIAALLGRRATLERAVAEAWLERVDPDVTGPIAPQRGFELEGAARDEVEAVDGSTIVVRFSTATRRFDGGGWIRLESTRISEHDLPVPGQFSGGLPMEQLAEAWADWQGAVETFNRAAWARRSAVLEAERDARAAREATLGEQRGVSELLDDSR
jgi:hypothetical protein